MVYLAKIIIIYLFIIIIITIIVVVAVAGLSPLCWFIVISSVCSICLSFEFVNKVATTNVSNLNVICSTVMFLYTLST